MSQSSADERYVQSIRRGSRATIATQYYIFEVPDGCVLTGIDVAGDRDSTVTAYYRPIQYLINGSWRTAGSA
ncbi:phage tail protein [Escherichia coli]|nr:phage tail protein [Escherichia coli]ELX0258617.1 phage tail protein [Escherichia coli]